MTEGVERGGVLTLDLAGTTGWAYWTPGYGPVYGSRRLARQHVSDRGIIYLGLHDWLTAKLLLYGPRVIAYEAPAMILGRPDKEGKVRGSTESLRKLIGYASNVEMLAQIYKRDEQPDCLIEEVPGATWYAHFVGGGRVKTQEKKEKTVLRCQQIGWQPQDNNAADALGILDYIVHKLRMTPDWSVFGAFGKISQ